MISKDAAGKTAIPAPPVATTTTTTTTTIASSGTSNSQTASASQLYGLQEQEWYHGIALITEIEKRLPQRGDWLVWSDDIEGTLVFFLSVRNSENNKVEHYRFIHSSKTGELMWTLEEMARRDDTTAASLETLVRNFERAGALPLANHKSLPLKQAIQRPPSLLRQSDVSVKQKLGEGNFCIVTLGLMVFENSIKRRVAIKTYKTALPDSVSHEQDSKNKRELLRECSLMWGLRHPNVVDCYGCINDLPPIKIVLEFCPGGNLLDHMHRFGYRANTGERLMWCFESARGMYYLEKHEIVHRDVAARNCLIAFDTTIKVSDFGLARKSNDLEPLRRSFRAPIRQMSPETIGKHGLFSHKSDVWAYALLCWEIFTNGKRPWPDDFPKTIAHAIKSHDMPLFPTNTPSDVIALANDCWNVMPAERPSFQRLTERMGVLAREPRFGLLAPSQRTLAQLDGVVARNSDNFAANVTVIAAVRRRNPKSNKPRHGDGHGRSTDSNGTRLQPRRRSKTRLSAKMGASRVSRNETTAAASTMTVARPNPRPLAPRSPIPRRAVAPLSSLRPTASSGEILPVKQVTSVTKPKVQPPPTPSHHV